VSENVQTLAQARVIHRSVAAGPSDDREMRAVAIWEPESDAEDEQLGTIVVGWRDRPWEAHTLGPMSLAEARRYAADHDLEFELMP
jgi:hypothetical protein